MLVRCLALHRYVGCLVTLTGVGEYMEAARELAEQLLSRELPRRWSHVAAVAKRADEVAPVLDVDADLLVSAAWLHDIGYAPQVVDTGFHPLDGARPAVLVGPVGLEPTTRGLKVRCSAS